MKKISKKITALIMALVIAVAIIPISGINLEADAATGSDVVAYARNYIGCPYVSGAKGPNAFDCSGFVYYVFNHFGIYIPNSTYDIWNNMSKYGTVIENGSTAKAQTGDLIVWSDHVAIYTSDGNCIEALNSRYGVVEAQFPINSHTNGMNYYVLRVKGLEDAKPIAPDAPVITADKTTAGKSELITISWKAVPGAETYRVLCKSGILTYVNSETTATSKTIGLAATGTYTVSVFAKNEAGETKSNEITLTIKSSSSHTHKYTAKITTAATCEKAGEKTFTCSCGDSYIEEIPATGHAYGDWIITKLSTVSSAGEKQRTCKSCGNKEIQTIPKLSSDALIIDKLSVDLGYKESAQLMANKTVKWSSSNAKVAAVDENGKVTAVGTGTAVITATAGSDTATCTVNVSFSWWQAAIDFIMNGIQLIMNFIGSFIK